MKSADSILTAKDKFYISLGLERISKILELLGNPQDKLKFIHVAGTNGKGSVCAFLNQILIENGIKTALYTSPHLFSYTERIRIDNIKISKLEFDKEVNSIVNLADKNNIHLTEFEILTAVAFDYFAKNNVDVVVLEVGLGGLYDATNVIKNPLVCIITTIDFDHKDRLGSTIKEITVQKAGIIKGNSTVIIGKDNLGFEFISAKTKNIIAVDDVERNSNLKGEHQKKNLALALGALKFLPFKIKEENIKKALDKVCWKFRLEYLEDKNILIDGCHNPSGALALRKYLDKNFIGQNICFVFGCLKNKDFHSMLKILIKENDELCFVEFSNKNSLKFNELPYKFKKNARKFNSDIQKKENLQVFCGSFYMLGEIFKNYPF